MLLPAKGFLQNKIYSLLIVHLWSRLVWYTYTTVSRTLTTNAVVADRRLTVSSKHTYCSPEGLFTILSSFKAFVT